jgi:hypothetical protein
MVVKSFRGLLADAGQDRIRLSTIKGKVGYKIIKFQIMNPTSEGSDRYSICQIWKEEQATPSASAVTIDFSDSALLASAISVWDNGQPNLSQLQVIFDGEIFNQDIYITHTELTGGGACNYYFELEVIPLDDAGAEYTTLKDMRQ